MDNVRALGMYGLTLDDLVANYGPESSNYRLCGGPIMLAASILSDCQEMMFREGPAADHGVASRDEIRQYLNRAKWVLFEHAKSIPR